MIDITIGNIDLRLQTLPELFSPNEADRGTLAMLAEARNLVEMCGAAGGKLLDLGCGYGLVGIFAAALGCGVTMTDIDPRAVECAAENAVKNNVTARVLVSDGFNALPDTGYELILSNPPYHADFSVPKRFIEKGFNRLVIGGHMVMVTKRLEWYRNKLTSVFGGVRVIERGGYYVFIAQKRFASYGGKSK